MTEPRLPPPAWYPDPGGSGGQRYWDGTMWTHHVAPPVGPAPPAGPAPRGLTAKPTGPQARRRMPGWGWGLIGIGVLFLAGIAAAVAIGGPRAVRAASRVSDSAAQEAARLGMDAANHVYDEDLSYRNAQPLRLEEEVPNINFTNGESTDFSTASVLATDEQFVIAVFSLTGNCWVLKSFGGSDVQEMYIPGFDATCDATTAAKTAVPHPFN